MKVLVCGGRDYADIGTLFATLDAMRDQFGPLTIIQGGAKGADGLARAWVGRQTAGRLINEPADWKQYGRAAGPLRNAVMIAEHRPDVVVAFPGGRGTQDLVGKAHAAGIKVIEVAA